MTLKRTNYYFLFVLLFLLLTGCSRNHLEYIGSDNWASTMSRSALTTGDISYKTRYFLVKNALMEDYIKDPEGVIRLLAKFVDSPNDTLVPGEDSIPETISALVELCAYQAQKTPEKDSITYWISSAFYSYRYIFGKVMAESELKYNTLDYTTNIKYYNYSTSKIFSYMTDNKISFEEPQGFHMVLGIVKFAAVRSDLLWSYSRFDDYINGLDYIPKNLQSHSYVSGIGVPVIGLKKFNTADAKMNKDLALLSQVYPFTFVLKFENFNPAEKPIQAQPLFFDSFNDESVIIDNQDVPLSKDYSLALAEFIDTFYNIRGTKYLFNPAAMGDIQGTYLLAPYSPNKIPVLLTHGLMSDPATWLEMLNTLLSDKTIRANYQFWLYTYPTGQPIYYSSYQFRQAILEVRKKYDPQSRDFGFNHMVLIGHSMGSLLSRLAVQDSEGYEFLEKWTGITQEGIVKLTPKEKEFLSNVGVFKPLPFVGCVILIATPNKGSEMANFTMARIGSYFITMPATITQNSIDAFRAAAIASGLHPDDGAIPNGIDSLAPSNKYLEYSYNLPFGKNVRIHSIIGNQNKAGETSGSDGVVPYSSSHIEKADSELIIKSDHSVHQKPAGIKEVSRILLEYLGELDKNRNSDTPIIKQPKPPANNNASKS